jgi:carboxyl-terminal processing protease
MPNQAGWICRFALWFLIGGWIGCPVAADEPTVVRFVPPTIPSQASSLEQLLAQTTTLENERRWGEALQLYAEAIRAHPDEPTLRQRQLLAQIHYDLNRRYNDQNFRRMVRETDASSAMAVYAEVLEKIDTYHVQTPDWNRVASIGAQSLEVALADPMFLQANIPNITHLQAATASQSVRQTLQNYIVRSKDDAYVVSGSLARQLESRIGLPSAATMYEFILGSMVALDPYSCFMTDVQFHETMSQIEGNFVGLGVELKTGPQRLEIVNVIPGGPAGKAGLRPGDLILAVDRRRTDDVGSEVAADLLRGQDGSRVQITIQRGTESHSLDLVRRPVDIPSITETRELERGIGYIRISSFQKTTTRDFDSALRQLQQRGMHSLIIDVRGNPGGLLSAAVEVADRFLSSGVIVSTRGRNPLEDFVHRAAPEGTWNIPLVVLVDENSASASEIFAAAIADHHRGKIVGARSYGKGSVQGIFPLNATGGGMRLTTAKFYGPGGEAIQDYGVRPDVLVHSAAKAALGVDPPATDEALGVALQMARQTPPVR